MLRCSVAFKSCPTASLRCHHLACTALPTPSQISLYRPALSYICTLSYPCHIMLCPVLTGCSPNDVSRHYFVRFDDIPLIHIFLPYTIFNLKRLVVSLCDALSCHVLLSLEASNVSLRCQVLPWQVSPSLVASHVSEKCEVLPWNVSPSHMASHVSLGCQVLPWHVSPSLVTSHVFVGC